jgi:hypothetical protein
MYSRRQPYQGQASVFCNRGGGLAQNALNLNTFAGTSCKAGGGVARRQSAAHLRFIQAGL